jgi:ABC-2 type transport system permease protein
MGRLFRIEWYKLRSTRYFRVLAVLSLVAFLLIPLLGNVILEWIENNINGISEDLILQPSQLPIFDFVDIWQNLAWVYKRISIILSFIVIISVTNDLDYKTARQNIIDGMSRKEFWLSKMSLVLALSGISTLLFLIIGLVIGYSMSPVTGIEYVFRHIEFVGAYFLQVFSMLMFSFMVSLIVKRSGFAIALIILWNYVVENVILGVNAIFDELEWVSSMWISNSMPLEAASNLIPNPLFKYVLMDSPDYIPWESLLIALAWLAFYVVFTLRRIQRRDF